MFDVVAKVKELFREPLPPKSGGSTPSKEVILGRRAWVVLKDGRIGYIDHYKDDGKFGVRPVDKATGLHYLNTSKHWTEEQRINTPEELALTLQDFRGANPDEIPAMYCRS